MSSRSSLIVLLLLVAAGLNATGSGTFQAAWVAFTGPGATTDSHAYQGMSADAGNLLLDGLAFLLLAGILVALADTQLYPVAFAVTALILLHVLLRRSSVLTAAGGPIQWASSRLGG